jgi:hypothetical protein
MMKDEWELVQYSLLEKNEWGTNRMVGKREQRIENREGDIRDQVIR